MTKAFGKANSLSRAQPPDLHTTHGGTRDQYLVSITVGQREESTKERGRELIPAAHFRNSLTAVTVAATGQEIFLEKV